MTAPRSVVLSHPVRTAIATFGGNLKEIPAPDLGAVAIKGALARAWLEPEQGTARSRRALRSSRSVLAFGICAALTQPQPSTQEMNDEHADVPGNRRDR
jgi:acetyl-CoA acetyltransferase